MNKRNHYDTVKQFVKGICKYVYEIQIRHIEHGSLRCESKQILTHTDIDGSLKIT